MTARVQPEPAALLAEHHVRPTRQRLAVLHALAGEPNDATAQEIHARLAASGQRTGLATVYRTLTLLSQEGIIDTLSHHPGEACYRLCTQEHHHHLVCDTCHRVVELDCDLDAWLGPRASEHGFVISGHTVEARGTCADCR